MIKTMTPDSELFEIFTNTADGNITAIAESAQEALEDVYIKYIASMRWMYSNCLYVRQVTM